MKARHFKQFVLQRPPPPSVEQVAAPPLLKCSVGMLGGDSFWMSRIRIILNSAGFIAKQIQREPEHPVWLMSLTRVSFALAADNAVAARQIRKLLVDGGIKIGRGELSVIDRRGDQLRCAFVLGPGKYGNLN